MEVDLSANTVVNSLVRGGEYMRVVRSLLEFLFPPKTVLGSWMLVGILIFLVANYLLVYYQVSPIIGIITSILGYGLIVSYIAQQFKKENK